jgi:DNA-binding CsgD family transcriptional regulator
VAIVTGGSFPAGRYVARGLARWAWPVVIVYLDHQSRTEATVAEIIAAGGTTIAVRADLADDLDVQRLFTESIARTHLLYGEWLRRDGHRLDARAKLNVAHEMFMSMGMEAFAQRAANELAATGEKRRRHVSETRDDLTAQERQIAELARDGLSNPQIGARLFLSPRTVEWHLRHVYSKLGIRTRRDLRHAL